MIWLAVYVAIVGWLTALCCWLDARQERRWRMRAMDGWQRCNTAWRSLVDQLPTVIYSNTPEWLEDEPTRKEQVH